MKPTNNKRLTKRLSAEAIVGIFEIFQSANAHPKTELVAPNPFCLLVAIVLSAQATDVSVNKATGPLFKVADAPEKMLALGEEGLRRYIKTIGLFNAKARNVIALCETLMRQHKSNVPTTREALMELPGVGRKTANVWLNCALKQPTIGVDTHVERVANRIGLCRTTNPLATELALEKIIPARFKLHAHHWLILHGRYVCKARKPECTRCAISHLCRYGDKAEVRI